MRIAIAGQTYDLKTNGQGVFTVHLAEGLARAGHEVMVLKPSDQGRAYRIESNGVRIQAIRAVSLAPLYRNVAVTPFPDREAGPLLREFQPAVVQIVDHYPLCRAVLRAARALRLPVVGSNHFLPENMAPYVPCARFCRAAVDRLLWRTVLPVLNQTEIVTTPTETAAAVLRDQQLRVPVEAISCGVDLERFSAQVPEDRLEMRRRYGLAPERILFLYTGRLDREKRIDVLIEAIRMLDRDDLQLAIVGQGRSSDELQLQAGALVRERRVVFTGFVPGDDLPGLLRSTDIFVMPSEAELQSIATLEAMAAGRPVLAANARALPELVENGVNGYLFRAGDAADAGRRIAQLADHPECWAEMGAASSARASRHRHDATVGAYEALYQRVTSAPRARLPRALRG